MYKKKGSGEEEKKQINKKIGERRITHKRENMVKI